MADDNSLIPRRTVLPPESRELQMPSGTPLGIGFLGAARFAAIRRVLHHAERAARATAGYIDARSEVNNALVRHAASIEQLNNIDTIRDDVATRIIEGAEINKLRLKLERMELEDKVAEREAARVKPARVQDAPTTQTTAATPPSAQRPDRFADIINDLQKMPGVVNAAAAAKEEIIKSAGGEQNMTDETRQMVETINSIVAAAMQKNAEGHYT